MSDLMYYMALDDWYQAHVGSEMNVLNPVARSVARKQNRMLQKMDAETKMDAYRYSEGEPFRWW